jgi:hypothetical protein
MGAGKGYGMTIDPGIAVVLRNTEDVQGCGNFLDFSRNSSRWISSITPLSLEVLPPTATALEISTACFVQPSQTFTRRFIGKFLPATE